MALQSQAIIIVTNLTGAPITFTDIRNTAFDPPANGYPTVAVAPGTLDIMLTPESLRSHLQGEVKAALDANDISTVIRFGQSGSEVQVHNEFRQGTQGANQVTIEENEIARADGPLILAGEPLTLNSTDVMQLTAAGRIILRDSALADSTWTPFATVDLALADTEWNTFIANFGEVSLVNAINASAVQSLDSAYNNGATVTTDAGPIILTGGTPTLRVNDDLTLDFGTGSDLSFAYDSASDYLLVTATQATGEVAGTGNKGPSFNVTTGTGTDAVASTNTGGGGGWTLVVAGVGGLAVEAVTGGQRAAGAGGLGAVVGGVGGAARGATAVANSAGDGGAGGAGDVIGGAGGAAQDASGTGVDHGAAGAGGIAFVQGGAGGAGSASEAGGSGGAVIITGGAGGVTGGGGAGADGSISLGATDTSGITLGHASLAVTVDGTTTFTAGAVVSAGGIQLGEGSAPTAVADAGLIYTKDITGITELFYREDSGAGGTEVQLTSNGAGTGGSTPEQLQHIANSFTVANTDGTVVVSQFAYDASTFSAEYATFSFRAVVSVTTGRTGTITLYNLTDAETVTFSGLGALTNTSPTKHEATMTVGAAAGNLKNTEKIYEIRLSVDGSTAAHTMTVGSSVIRLEV